MYAVAAPPCDYESVMPTQSKWQSLPTEAINPASLAIDKTPVRDIIEMVINEDRKVIAAVQKEKERIAHGVEIIARSLRKGGRIIFIGAGTSGRLGVVEASEMPPTFGTAPRIVQAIMAGGQEAVFQAKEGVEDNYEEGARSIGRLRLTQRDVVVGVSASGMTPVRARRPDPGAQGRRARSSSSPAGPAPSCRTSSTCQIAPAVGPELIAGSTRLKAGTATKMVLNMLTTVAMIKFGKTYGNLMVDVQTGSEKLKDRARRILGIVTGLDYDEADAVLKRSKWNVKAAIVMQKTRADAAAGASAAEEGRRLGARGDRRGLPNRRLRALMQETLKPAAAAASTTTSTAGWSWRNDAGRSRRDRPAQQTFHDAPPSTSRSRAGRSVAPEGSSPSPSTAPPPEPAPDRPRTTARCCASFRFERDPVGPRLRAPRPVR